MMNDGYIVREMLEPVNGLMLWKVVVIVVIVVVVVS